MKVLLAALPVVMLLMALSLQASHAAFTVLNINTTVALNQNTSAQVTDIIEVSVNGSSVQEYSTDRLALNLTISQWQNIIGPSLVEHIVNPEGGGIYGFNFLPGPIVTQYGNKVAFLVLTYSVTNVTTVNQTGPRTFLYRFNDKVFNFQHALSGPVLGSNTTFTVLLPAASDVQSVYPLPDYPPITATQNYRNATRLQWNSGEPLSNFDLTYTVEQSLQSEVLTFFSQLYQRLGGFSYVIVVVAVVLFIIYTYLKIEK